MKNILLLEKLLGSKTFVATSEIKKIVANPSASISLLRKRGLEIVGQKGDGYLLVSIARAIEVLKKMKEVDKNFSAKKSREKTLGLWESIKLYFSR